MKTTLHILLVALLFVGLIGCEEVESPGYGISIEGIPGDTTLVENTTLTLNITVTANDGLTNFKIGNNYHPVAGLKTYSTTLDIEASLDDPSEGRLTERKFYVSFYARDKRSAVLQKQFQVTVIPDSKVAEENPESPVLPAAEIFNVTSDIVKDEVWSSENIYILKGRIAVLPGAKLTIQKGVIVKGDQNVEEISSLVITRGAQIDAQGTNEEPIIFTSTMDRIVPGTIEPSLSVTFFDDAWWDEGRNPDLGNQKGLWGGLIILGGAHGSFPGDTQEIQVEGIPISDGFGKYGGLNNEDNSGILKNISIRYAGNKLHTTQKLSALTLAGVGSGTHIENIEIHSSATDGISIYGGNVNLENVLLDFISNYGVRIDQGWSGTLDNFIISNAANAAFDIYGPRGSYFNGNHQVVNGLISSWFSKGLVSFHENSNTDLKNVLIQNITHLEFGFSINPKTDSHQPKFDRIEVFEILEWNWLGEEKYSTDKFNELFKDWDESQIKLVTWDKNTVGPYLERFVYWSWVYSLMSNNGSQFPGI